MFDTAGAMAVLAATDPAHLTWLERLDLVRAWERQLSWAAAGRLAAVAALEDPDPGESPNPLPEFVPDWCREEIATALHVTGPAAQNQLDLARELRARLAATSAALRAGRLTERKAELIARAVRDLDDAVAAAVEAAVLPDAAHPAPCAGAFTDGTCVKEAAVVEIATLSGVDSLREIFG